MDAVNEKKQHIDIVNTALIHEVSVQHAKENEDCKVKHMKKVSFGEILKELCTLRSISNSIIVYKRSIDRRV